VALLTFGRCCGGGVRSSRHFVQTAGKAKDYLDNGNFSRSGLIAQLKYEGFTQAQAEYGAREAGL
jgi:hypothetical protein